MSFHQDVYPDHQLVVVRFAGAIDSEDIKLWIDAAPTDSAFDKHYDGVVDLRGAVFKNQRPEKAKLLGAYMIERDFTTGRWVTLASKPMETALTLVYRTVAEQQHPIKIYSTVEAAERFLERDLSGLVPRREGLVQDV